MNSSEHNRNSDRVSRTVWDWRTSRSTASLPSRRRAVLLRCGIGLLMATALALWFPRLAAVAAALTVLLAAVGLAAPAAYGRIDALLATFGRTVGALLTGLLLGLLFVLWFVPGRLLLLLRRRDPLRLRFPADDATFWIPYRPAPDRSHYERQSR